jgi:hypothetical protein
MSELFIKDGKIKNRKHIVITKDGMTTFNPTAEMLLEDGWEVYVAPEPTEEELLARAKRDKKREIEHYDSSSSVNEFYLSEVPVWLDKATRTGLMLRFNAEIALGKTETVLWYGNISIPLQLTTAVQMLYALEIYASACYDNTQSHYAAVDTLETIEEVESYDYRVGYPEKLRF